jgi:hypothetical protein
MRGIAGFVDLAGLDAGISSALRFVIGYRRKYSGGRSATSKCRWRRC